LKKLLTKLVLLATLVPAAAGASEFEPKEDAVDACPGDFFTQGARVFGALKICATENVPPEKLEHAARVAAAWLDNDLNGRADELRLISSLKSAGATLIMSADGFSGDALDTVMADADAGGFVIHDLSAAETAPETGRDVSQKEIHHLIVTAGWARAFPRIFSDVPEDRSTVFRLWQKAEAKGYYSYDDETCDDACKAVEFHYLAAAAYLGSEADLQTGELKLPDRAALKRRLPGMVKVFQSGRYKYPRQHWPDGNYQFDKAIEFTP